MNGGVFIAIPLDVLRRPDLSAPAKLTYGRLDLYADKSGEAWPSVKTLAEQLGTSTRTMKRILKELRQAGLVERISCPKKPNAMRIMRPEPGPDLVTTGAKSCQDRGQIVSRPVPDLAPPSEKTHKKNQEKNQEKSASSDAMPQEMSEVLDTPAFREVWEEWHSYRVGKNNPLTPIEVRKQLDKLAEKGEVEAISTLNKSMANGWPGVDYPDRSARRPAVADHAQQEPGQYNKQSRTVDVGASP